MDYEQWQKQWDAQQEAYMPDREERFAALLDTISVVCGETPRVLDLAGGTGSITRRLLGRFPGASSVVVDLDPALLAIAGGTFLGDSRVTVVNADLSDSAWLDALSEGAGRDRFDAVVTATALHWLPADRVAALYTEAVGVLSPGGLVANADHMADEELAVDYSSLRQERAERIRAETGAPGWDEWWEELAAESEMTELVAARRAVYPGASHVESVLSSAWHRTALEKAGCTRVGLAWRALDDALVVGITA